MSAGFTRGPWEYTATVSFHDRPDLPCVIDRHRLVVAQCWDDGHDEAECEANANLIAAAPDLLEALEAILEYAFDGPPYDAAVAAIAKARGLPVMHTDGSGVGG